jgi:peptidyl-prolyl cis-trans isomerase B (cyclophilin B)
MHQLIGALIAFSILVPQKIWFAPDQPVNITVKADGNVTLTLTDFSGKTQATATTAGGKNVDLKTLFPAVGQVGTYIVWDGTPASFDGTPLVVEVRSDKHPGAPPGPLVVKVEPLSYAVMDTDAGKLKCVFYYDVAPNTVDNFLNLAEGGYYDGLSFHRILPGFVIQGGDPKGDGSGGPGYSIPAEFNDHQHQAGVLSMARTSDPDSAGSQFFVCLDYAQTQHLDNQYTAFGKVVDGMDAVKKIAATPLTDPNAGTPATRQGIVSVRVFPVTKGDNPYSALFQ